MTTVVIVGGGTTGWVAAAALANQYKRIALIDSASGHQPVMAESTVPALLFFHRSLDINEADLMASTGATFKLAVAFENWSGPQHDFFHAYSPYGGMIESIDFQHFVTRLRQRGGGGRFDNYSLAAAAARSGRFAHPRADAKAGFLSLPYAVHLDSESYCAYLRRYAERRGVSRIPAAVADVSLRRDDAAIEALVLDNGERIEADLFIDCSGGEGLLIGKALGVGYREWSHYLPCNRRLCAASPAPAEPAPVTRLTRHDNGWQRSIPLRDQLCHEYYYCSDQLGDDQAGANLRAAQPDTLPGDIQVQRLVPGRREQFWHKNCVALGAAAGFLENFTVSNLHLAQSGILRLLDLFPQRGCDALSRKEYNSLTAEEYDRILDFHTLHYRIAAADSPFWQAVKERPLPPSLEHKMTLFKHTGRFPFYERETFAAKTWISFLLGHNYWPDRYDPRIDMLDFPQAAQQLQRIEAAVKETVNKMPPHHQYLARYCPAAAEPGPGRNDAGLL